MGDPGSSGARSGRRPRSRSVATRLDNDDDHNDDDNNNNNNDNNNGNGSRVKFSGILVPVRIFSSINNSHYFFHLFSIVV